MSRRTERLGEEIREEVSAIVGGELKDPRIGLVTVTRVTLAADLRNARVFVAVTGTEKERAQSLAGLRKAAGFIRHALGQSLRLRYTPELHFIHDEGLDATERVAQLLDEVKASEAARDDDAE